MLVCSILRFPFKGLKEGMQIGFLPKIAMAVATIRSPSLLFPKSVVDDFYKGAIALMVHPLNVGDRIKVEQYDGVVRNIGFWYLTLERSKGYVFLPMSKIYNTVIELFK